MSHQREAAEDDRATLEVASMNGPPWAEGAPTRLGGDPEHAAIDSDEEEPTVEAGMRQLGRRRGGTLDEPTIDRQDGPVPTHSRGSGRRPPYQQPHQQPPPAALGPAWAKLVITAGNDNGREFPLNGKPITVGRALDNDVVLSDIAVSRKHLSLAFDGRRYILIDHASGNGTMINDRLETGTCLLTHGDRLELGNTMVRLEHPASRGLAPAQPDASGFEDDEARTVVGKSKRKIAPLPAPGGPAPMPAPMPAAQPQHRLPIPADPGVPKAGSPALPAPVAPVARRAALPAPTARPDAAAAEPSRIPTAEPEHIPSGPMLALAEARHQSDPGMANLAIPAQMPPEALLTTSPIPRFPPFAQPRRSRRGLVFVLLLTIVAVGGAIAFVMASGGWPLQDPDELAAGAPDDDADDDADDRAAVAPLPTATWGTDETTMLASIGVTETPSVEPDDQAADPADPPDPADPGPEEADLQATDTTPPDSDQGLTKDPAEDPAKDPAEDRDDPGDSGDSSAGDDDRDNDRQTKPVTRTTKPVRRATRVDRPNTSAARKRAQAQYRDKDFGGAAQILRSTASEASGKEAGELRSLASGYDKVGAAMSKGNAAFSRDPVTAMDAYRSALNLDKRYGDGVHASFIRSKLSVVAPKAAASFMAKNKYEAAKSAADTAASTGTGSTPMVQRVRQGLERQAGEFYKSALRMKNEPQKANKLLQRIIDMVPPSSPWYSKAYKRLNSR